MHKLTPAQERLIKDAKTRPDFRVITFGVSFRTIEKLIEAGFIEKVSALSVMEKHAIRVTCTEWSKQLGYVLEKKYDNEAALLSKMIYGKITQLDQTIYVLTKRTINQN